VRKTDIANAVARESMYDEQAEKFIMKLCIVVCKACGNEHETRDVEFLNVEEDIQGRDVIEFKCPETGTVQKSYVLSK
jgi:hypothetical protein